MNNVFEIDEKIYEKHIEIYEKTYLKYMKNVYEKNIWITYMK